MGLIRHDWKSRQQLRDNLEDNPFFKAGITPVLLSYWTQESLYTYLIPATQDELNKLMKVNGIDCNGTGWEAVTDVFDYIHHKQYDANVGDHGEWREKYLVDTHDDKGNPLPPINVPPGTVVIITGMIL